MISPELRKRLDDLVHGRDVVLFMKGRRTMPQCGFSAKVVSILDEIVDDYETVNVLADPDIREGIKAYSEWPTIPQLYVKGQFVGGSDIVTSLAESGELYAMLGREKPTIAAPKVTVTEAAKAELREAVASEPGASVRLAVDARFRPGLDLGRPQASDFQVDVGGLVLLVDRGSAARANGVSIDFVPGASGGFKIENPNAPPAVKRIGPKELQAMRARGEVRHLVDVRTEAERQIARIEGAELLDANLMSALEAADKDAAIVFQCHHGGRSLQAAQAFLQKGFKNVYNLEGGIDAWSMEVDPTIPRY